MLIPILVFVACFGAGVTASAKWLPDLGPGPIAGLAFFTVCGLLGLALSVAGLDAYSMIRQIHEIGGEGGKSILNSSEILASGVRSIFFESGTLVGFAGILYLLAPPGPDESEALEATSAIVDNVA